MTPLVIFLLAGSIVASNLSPWPVSAGLFAAALFVHALPAFLRPPQS